MNFVFTVCIAALAVSGIKRGESHTQRNIVLVSDVDLKASFKFGAGSGVWVLEVAKSLVDLGCRVTVLSPCEFALSKFPEGPDFRCVTSSVAKYSPFKTLLFFSVAVAQELRRLTQDTHVDLVLFNSLTGLFSLLSPSIPRALHVTVVHGVLAANPSRMASLVDPTSTIPQRIKRLLGLKAQRNLERVCYRASPTIVANSRSVMTDLHKHYGISLRQISVVHNGLNHDLFRPFSIHKPHQDHASSLGFSVLYSGTLGGHKGLFHLLLALSKVVRTGREVTLFMVGKYNSQQYSRVKGMIRRLGLTKQAVILGPVPYPDMPQYYQSADVTVVPSFYEGFGMTSLESMACGTPVIVSKVGGLEEVVSENTGIMVSPGDTTGISNAIISLYDDEALRERLAENARKRSMAFSWTSVARRILEVV